MSFPRIRLIVIVLVAFMLGLSDASAASASDAVPLVEDGRAVAVIVLPDEAGERSIERDSAELLATFIERMSGARLSIRHERELDAHHVADGWIEPGLPGDAQLGDEKVPGEQPVDHNLPTFFVLLGDTTLSTGLDVHADELGPGGLRLTTRGNAVILLGGPAEVEGEPGSDAAGVRHAAIELLERLGCRYLWPGETGLVIPRRTTVAVEPSDAAYTPPIRRRGIRWGRGPDRGRPATGLERLGIDYGRWQAAHDRAIGRVPDVRWSQWQRLGGRMPTFGHAGAGLRNAEYHLEHHPEWFALQADGTRDQAGSDRWRLCHSNPDLIAHVAEDIISRRDEDPGLQLVSLDPNDGSGVTGWCQCANCKALDPVDAPMVNILIFPTTERRAAHRGRIEHPALTDRLLHYWNAIAERVAETHPDLLLGVSAYSGFSHPPVEQQAHPNLVLRYVPSHTEYVEGWREAGIERMYWRPNILLANRRDGKLRSIAGRLAETMHFFADGGIVQTDFDSILHYWSTFGLSYYAAARLSWDPYLPADRIIADFAHHGFGEGAPHIEAYFQRVEDLTKTGVSFRFQSGDERRFTREVVADLHGLLDAAEEAADAPAVSDRVAFLRVGLNYTMLHAELDDLARRARDGEAFDEKRARRLVDLHCLMLREILLHHTLAVNVPYMVWGSGTFAHLAPIGGRTVEPSDPALLDRIADDTPTLTGGERTIDNLLEAFGL